VRLEVLAICILSPLPERDRVCAYMRERRRDREREKERESVCMCVCVCV